MLYTDDLSNITFNYFCENSPNDFSHFWNHRSFFTTQILCIFLAQTLHTFYKSRLSTCKFSFFSMLALKFTKLLMSFSKQRVGFFINVWIFFHCHERQLFGTFLAETIYAIKKSSTTSKCTFSDLPLLPSKFTKFLMSFLEPRASFSSNLTSLFIVMRPNSSVHFHLNLYML